MKHGVEVFNKAGKQFADAGIGLCTMLMDMNSDRTMVPVPCMIILWPIPIQNTSP